MNGGHGRREYYGEVRVDAVSTRGSAVRRVGLKRRRVACAPQTRYPRHRQHLSTSNSYCAALLPCLSELILGLHKSCIHSRALEGNMSHRTTLWRTYAYTLLFRL
jgi:hypothetical protein